MYQQDWLMRQIEAFVYAVCKQIFNRDTAEYIPGAVEENADADLLHRELLRLLEACDFCAAENLLYREFVPGSEALLQVAADFYRRLNEFSDEALLRGNFSREEIEEGLRDLVRKSGFDLPGVL